MSKLEEKTVEFENLSKNYLRLEQNVKFKDEEILEIGLSSNSLEKNYEDLRHGLRDRENEIKEKKNKIKDYEKRIEILEKENSKMAKVFHAKLQEIEDIKGRASPINEIEELRNSNDTFKKINMVIIFTFFFFCEFTSFFFLYRLSFFFKHYGIPINF